MKTPNSCALFISDLHLQASHPLTTNAFLTFLQVQAKTTQQLYILGDLFEYWAGDDDMETSYHQKIVIALKQLHEYGVAVFWIAGNRDFLIGEHFAQSAQLTILPDPSVIQIAGSRLTITHGDAQCTDDLDYIAWRTQVRDPRWQTQFLTLPLKKRKDIIANVRQVSQEKQREKTMEIMDVNAVAIQNLFDTTASQILIHGHTHRPARHLLENNRVRYVLPDWEYDAYPARGGWIQIDQDAAIRRFGQDGQELFD